MKFIFRILSCIFLFILIIVGGCTQKKNFKIGISQCSSDDWRNKMNEEIILESLLHDDIEIEIRSGDDDSQNQIEDLEYFVKNKFDIIVVAPNEAASLTPEIEKIYKSGIPVIIFDRNINGSSYTQRIGVNNEGLGASAADYAFNLLSDSIRALEIYGLPDSSPAEDRSKGFNEVLNKGKGRVSATAHADWQKEKAKVVTDSLLKLYPNTNLIFAHNDRMAIGASEVADQSGREDIKIIGIDAAPQIGLHAVADGVIDATFLYPTKGHLILREAIKIVKGEPFEREILLPISSAVDSSNADILLLQNETIEEDTEKINTLKSQIDDFLSRDAEQKVLFYAIITILFLLFGVLFLVLRTFWQHRHHREVLLKQNKLLETERDKQKELNERLEVATQSKLVFFTNVSHDLRTPLTLIAEPVSQLKDASNLTNQQHSLIKIADKNVKILHRLIDQILDFRKYENNKLKLILTEIDFRATLREWLELFYEVAKKHNIKITLEEPEGKDPILIALDTEKIERVFFNLISNALKYSHPHSSINVSYALNDSKLILKVEDTGEGIDKEILKQIFEPFFQVERVRPRGSGIGLSLAKAFVELHGGEISVESELNKGTVFTVTLPVVHVSEKAEKAQNIITEDDINAEFQDVETELEFSENKPLLLIIDDNSDIRDMVSELMKDDYNIIRASNGSQGLKKSAKYVPDLIICDIMMPGIDGIEVCDRLKSELVTSHIPVLMLTACTMDEQRLQGYESGAEGFLAKPFSSEILKAQARSLIANRKRIKRLYDTGVTDIGLETAKEKLITTQNTDIDNEFYNNFIKLFTKHMGDPDLNVESLASQMGFERTQFYRKIKAITNYSPVELMRNLRLKKARVLLTSSEKSVSEIGYEVGFSTPAYFTKCYREMFGETPTETRSHLN